MKNRKSRKVKKFSKRKKESETDDPIFPIALVSTMKEKKIMIFHSIEISRLKLKSLVEKEKNRENWSGDRVPSRMKSSWIPAESVHPPEGNSRWRGRVESFQEKFRTVSRPVIGI